jgi:hypothetical protein
MASCHGGLGKRRINAALDIDEGSLSLLERSDKLTSADADTEIEANKRDH